jgi:hypothetical protein
MESVPGPETSDAVELLGKNQPVTSTVPSQASANKSGGAADFTTDVGDSDCTGNLPPTRAASAASPRSRRRCLQVRRSIGSDWYRQAGQEQE